MADEDVVLDRHAFADERMTRDFAAPADRRVLLNFDECPDLGLVANGTAIQVDELAKGDARTETDVRRDSDPFVHGHAGICVSHHLLTSFSS